MSEFIRNFGAARFGVMAGSAAALTGFFLYVAGVISEPAKTILYAGLEPRDAARSIVERFRPSTTVMSQNEIHASVRLRTLGQV